MKSAIRNMISNCVHTAKFCISIATPLVIPKSPRKSLNKATTTLDMALYSTREKRKKLNRI
jgi:hypothetical protein